MLEAVGKEAIQNPLPKYLQNDSLQDDLARAPFKCWWGPANAGFDETPSQIGEY